MTRGIQVTGGFSRSRLTSLAKETYWIAFGQLLSFAACVLGVRVLTGLMPPEEYGRATLALTFTACFSVVFANPVFVTSRRFFWPAIEGKSFRSYCRAMRPMAVFMIAGWLCMLFAGGAYAHAHLGFRWAALALTACLFAAVLAGNTLMNGIQDAARYRKTSALHTGLFQCSKFLGAVVCIAFLGPTGEAAMLGFALGGVPVVASSAYFFRRDIIPLTGSSDKKAPEAKDLERAIRRYFWPFILLGVFTWLFSSADRWALSSYTDLATVGRYGVLYQIGYQPTCMAFAVINSLIAPIAFSHAGVGNDQERCRKTASWINHCSILLLIVLSVGVCLAAALHSYIFALCVGAMYQSVSCLLPLVVAAAGLKSIGEIYSFSVLATGKSRDLLANRFVTCALAVVVYLGCASQFGVVGVVWASLIIAGILLVWNACLAVKVASCRTVTV